MVRGDTDRIQQIATTADEQSRVVEQITSSIGAVSQVSKQTASGARQTLSASRALNSLARALQEMLSGFQLNRNEGRGWRSTISGW